MGDGDEKSQAQVGDLMPRRVKKRRKIETEDGSDQGWEEYFDYIFPEDEAAKPNLKLLAMVKMWKKQKEAVATEDTEGEAEQVEERIPIGDTADSAEVDAENPDADDQDIVNESSDEDSEEEEEEEEVDRKRARLK